LPIGIIHVISANPASRRSAIKRKKTMFKTFAAVLIAASMLTAPAFAQSTTPAPSAPAAQMTKAPAVKVVKAKRHHVKKHVHARVHVKHVRHARHHRRHHVRHASVKRTHVHVARQAPKASAN
jgi:hypothetical protein